MTRAAVGGTSLWSSFETRANVLGASVKQTPSQDTALEVLRAAASEFSCTASIGQRYPRVAAAGVSRPTSPCPEMVALGQFAVAETGSVVLDEPRSDRGACFLAERLWLLVPASELVATLDLAVQRVHRLVSAGAHHPLLMSGPSRTADIERVLTIGVHGPRELAILIVGET